MNAFTKTLRVLLCLKALAALVCLAVYLEWLRPGEPHARAAKTGVNPRQGRPDRDRQKNAPQKQDEGQTAQHKRNGRDHEAEHGGGLLDSLLSLPPLEADSSNKDEVGRYLSIIEQARQQIEDRMTSLKSRYRSLKELEQSIDSKLKDLDHERQFFIRTIQQEKKIQKDRLARLVDLYEKMEPKKAAPVFETMDKDLVVSLFNTMKKKQVTRIIELMEPKKSVELTEYFGRIGSAKEYDLLKEMNKSLRKAFANCKEPEMTGG